MENINIQELKTIPALKNKNLEGKNIITDFITDEQGNKREVIIIRTSTYTNACKNYFQKNKEKLSQKHREYERERYKNDPEFRAKKIENAKKTQEKAKLRKQKEAQRATADESAKEEKEMKEAQRATADESAKEEKSQ